MPVTILPFKAEVDAKGGLSEEELFQWLSEDLREAAQQNRHLKDYLRAIPIEDIGVPEYYLKLSRGMGGGQKNLIYPVADDIFIHIYSDPGGGRGHYIPIEPDTMQDMTQIMQDVEENLINVAETLYEAETKQEKAEALMAAVAKICEVKRGATNGKEKNKKQAKIQTTPEQFEALKYVALRDKLGLGVTEPILLDPYIEDISQSGIGPLFVEHKIFKSLESSIVFETTEDLDDFVLRLSEAIGRPVTLRKPIVDATLPDGSRINIVFGTNVSRNGSNFSIRKFTETPMSILDLVGLGSVTYQMAAYFSIVVEDGCNVFIVGEAASGKTTLMNAITTFIPRNAKIVSIEDTPELQVPHSNWLREVSKTTGVQEKGAQVSMFDLLKAALRQRPNFIIVGEIRGAEGAIAFGAMQTGHSVMSTFHASNVEKVIQRLTGNPINIPNTYIDSLNIVVCVNNVSLPGGESARRVTSISEIVGYDASDDAFSYVEVFQWDPAADKFEFVGNKNSFLLEEKIAPKRGYPSEKRWKIYTLLEKRAKIMERLHKEKEVSGFHEFFDVIDQAQREGLF
ncbi:MAG: type II/IV secretion system ATPase subunit [Dehalococcoidia bacterium]